MPLSSKDQFGPYTWISLLGEGGVGELYRAREARLKRNGAIEALPEGVGQDGDRSAGFGHEAWNFADELRRRMPSGG
jgi:hypothetical protein